MPLFRKKHKSPSPAASPAFRSVEQLIVFPPSTAPSPRVPPEDLAFSQRFADVRLPTSPDPPDPYSQHHHQQNHHQLYQIHPDQNPSEHPPPYQRTITRSQSHHSPTLLNSVLATPASPAAAHFIDADPPDQSSVDRASEQPALAPKQDSPQKSRRKIFGLSSSSSSSTGFLERSVSVKGTASSQSSRQRRHQQQLSLDTDRTHRDRDHQKRNINHHSSSETVPEDHMVDPNRGSSQSLLMQQDTASAHQRPPRSPQHPTSIQRSNTDSSLLEKLYNSSPVDSARQSDTVDSNQSQKHLQQQHSPVSQLQVEAPSGARPPSRQSLGPPSPLPPFSHQPDRHQSGMASSDRPAAPPQTQPQGPGSHPPFQGGNQQNASESGRSTPPVSNRRDDPGEIDVRALLQKHDELRKTPRRSVDETY